jgi:hypothetical protein
MDLIRPVVPIDRFQDPIAHIEHLDRIADWLLYVVAYEQYLIALEAEGRRLRGYLSPRFLAHVQPQFEELKRMREKFNNFNADLRSLLALHGYMHQRFMSLTQQAQR